ncbi:MAG: glycosyltransferase family protein [bacterium]
MSRILYGVQGNGHGHAIRALTVARHYPQHEFLFVSHDDGIELLRPEYPVHECWNPETPIRAHRIEGCRIVLENLHFWLKKKSAHAFNG